jgi:hypothetical protein
MTLWWIQMSLGIPLCMLHLPFTASRPSSNSAKLGPTTPATHRCAFLCCLPAFMMYLDEDTCVQDVITTLCTSAKSIPAALAAAGGGQVAAIRLIHCVRDNCCMRYQHGHCCMGALPRTCAVETGDIVWIVAYTQSCAVTTLATRTWYTHGLLLQIVVCLRARAARHRGASCRLNCATTVG